VRKTIMWSCLEKPDGRGGCRKTSGVQKRNQPWTDKAIQ